MSVSLKDELVSAFKKVSKYVAIDEVKDTRPTKIKLLDTILNGGFVVGATTMLVGTPGSGKSTIAAQFSGALLEAEPEALAIYFDSEQSFSHQRLRQLGVNDTSRAMIVSVDVTMEKIFEYLDKILEIKEKNKIQDIPFAVVWDSVAATGSERADDIDKMEQMTGYEARILSYNLKKYLKDINKYNIIFIAINQLRDKIQMDRFSRAPDLRWLGNKDVYGGNALKFQSFTILYMQPTSPEFHGETPQSGSGGLLTGFEGTSVKVYAIKNKLLRPNVRVQLALDYNKGFNDPWTNLLFLKDKKIVTSGAWWKIDGIDKKFRAKEFLSLYNSDEVFRNKFEEIVLEELNKFKKQLETTIDASNVISANSDEEEDFNSEDSAEDTNDQ